MEGTQFLKQKYNLHASPEVARAAKRTLIHSGEKVPQQPAAQIQNYLDRFKEITERKDDTERLRGLAALKKILHEEYVISEDNFPESYFRLQERIARERGEEYELTDEKRKEAVEVITHDQEISLDQWIDYLASEDALYPDWAKYWSVRSVLGLSSYNKETHEFGKRTKDTTAAFPDLNAEALAYVTEVMEKRLRKETIANPVEEGENPFAEDGKKVTDEEFEQLLTTENFGKYYAFAIEYVTADNSELFKITEGEWKIYKQSTGEDLEREVAELTSSIQGHGTGWCTAGKGTATKQLEQGDFYVYYSLNALGEPTIPRLAIRMSGDRIAEIRGVAHKQEIDPFIAPVLEEKMTEFGEEGQKYIEIAEQMKLLTHLVEKNNNQQPLTADELKFLYEVENPISGFGYQRDPRIDEVKGTRSLKEDLMIMFETSDSDSTVLAAASIRKFHTILKDTINEFAPLNKETAYELISKVGGDLVVKNLDIFEGIDRKELAIFLIKANYGRILFENVDQFPKLDEAMLIDMLSEKGRRQLLAENVEYFSETGPSKILQLLFENGAISEIAWNLSNFPTIPRDIADALFENKEYAALANNLDKCTHLDRLAIYDGLVKNGSYNAILQNIAQFPHVDVNELVLSLLDTRHELDVAVNLKYLKRLSFEAAQHLIANNHSGDVAHHLESFKRDDIEEIIKMLAPSVRHLTWTLKKFTDLSAELAYWLVDQKDNASEVVYAKEAFTGLDDELLVRKLLEKNQQQAVFTNIYKFKGISAETLDLLVSRLIPEVVDEFSRTKTTTEAEARELVKGVLGLYFSEDPGGYTHIDQEKIKEALQVSTSDEFWDLLKKFDENTGADLLGTFVDDGHLSVVFRHLHQLTTEQVIEIAERLISREYAEIVIDRIDEFPYIDEEQRKSVVEKAREKINKA